MKQLEGDMEGVMGVERGIRIEEGWILSEGQ